MDQLHISVAHARWLHAIAGFRFHKSTGDDRVPEHLMPLQPLHTLADLAQVTHVTLAHHFKGDIGDDNNDCVRSLRYLAGASVLNYAHAHL